MPRCASSNCSSALYRLSRGFKIPGRKTSVVERLIALNVTNREYKLLALTKRI